MNDTPSHSELVESLAADHDWPGRLVFAEHRVGSWWLQNGCPTPDVLVMRCSYTKPDVTIFEVKANRADFLGDVRREKWRSYLPYCSRFLFAAPRGIIKREDLPAGCGLAAWGAEKGWHVTVAGSRRPAPEFTGDQWMSLLFARGRETARTRDLKERMNCYEGARHRRDARKLAASVRERLARYESACDALGSERARFRHLFEALAHQAGLSGLEAEKFQPFSPVIAEVLQHSYTSLKHRPVVCPWGRLDSDNVEYLVEQLRAAVVEEPPMGMVE